MPVLTAAQIKKIAPKAQPVLVAALVGGRDKIAAAGIDTPLRLQHFLAQIATETGGFASISENLNYSAKRLTEVWPNRFPTLASAKPYEKNPEKLAEKVYGGRKDLGNTKAGDGWRYRGGGFMQNTGRANYRAAGYEDNPDLLRTPGPALEAALEFWTRNRCNEIADRDDLKALRKRINGGANGLADAQVYLMRAKQAIPVEEPDTISPVPITAPAVTTIDPAGKAPGIFGALWNMLRGRKAVPTVPAIAGTKNDPTIFYVQKMLKERAYYTKGFVDGLDGGLTQQAVAQARKDNGMGDGGIDAEFLTRLPSFPQRPVSKARSEIGIVAATQHAPEVMKPSLGLLGTGLSLLGIGGSDEIAGVLGSVQGAAGQAGEIMATVQTAFGTLASVFTWVVEHRRMILILLAVFCIFKAISWLLSGWIKIRQAFF